MEQILFFDSDNLLQDFVEAHPIPGTHPVFIDTSLNATDIKSLEPYRDIHVLSCFTHSETLPEDKLDLFPNLRLIATRSTGFNHINLEYCRKRGIAVANVPAYGATTVAEFAFALLLALARKVIRAKNDMAHNRIEMKHYLGFDLFGKTIGIIGTGSIGRHMVRIAQGFGMNIIAYDPYPSDALKGIYVNDITTIFRESDIISLHIPSTPENHHLLDMNAFQQMKPGVIIINTARGDLIDTQALYMALKNGIVGGAGLDVLENEDFLLHDEIMVDAAGHTNDFLLDSAMNLKLLQFRNVIATPHIAFNSIDAINRINEITLDNIRGFQNGSVPNNVIRESRHQQG